MFSHKWVVFFFFFNIYIYIYIEIWLIFVCLKWVYIYIYILLIPNNYIDKDYYAWNKFLMGRYFLIISLFVSLIGEHIPNLQFVQKN